MVQSEINPIVFRVTFANSFHQSFLLIFDEFPEPDRIDAIYSHELNCTPTVALPNEYKEDSRLVAETIGQLLSQVFRELHDSPAILTQSFTRFKLTSTRRSWYEQRPLLDYKVVG